MRANTSHGRDYIVAGVLGGLVNIALQTEASFAFWPRYYYCYRYRYCLVIVPKWYLQPYEQLVIIYNY